VQITTAEEGPALLKAEPHPLPWIYLIILGLRNHGIGLWVVLLLNQSKHQEMHPGFFASFPMMSLRLAAAASRAPSAMPGRRVARSSARRQVALIQHQSMSRMNLVQTRTGFSMPHSRKALFSSWQLLTLHKGIRT